MAIELDEPLDVFGQNPKLSRLYTQLCFCFPVPDSSPGTQSSIVSHLKSGLERLTASFPWVAGQVVQEDGIFKVVPFEKTPILAIEDFSNDVPTFEEYRKAGFPFRILDERIISARNTLPERFNEPALVFLLQANFITGGLLLVFSARHNCMDMAGQGQVIHLFAKACREEPFTAEELRIGNLPRRNAIPLLTNHRLIQEQISPEPPTVVEKGKQGPAVWANILFSGTSISTLKSFAMSSIPSGFISTDDVLSALLWQAITRARLPRLASCQDSTFERQVDARKYLGLPATYVGNAVYKTSTTLSIQMILNESVGTVAAHLRASLNRREIADKVLGEATLLSQNLSSTAKIPTTSIEAAPPRPKIPPTDIKMSSWAKGGCYELVFGNSLGKVEAVRRPRFEAWEGLAYLLPKRGDGEIAAAVCLREEDLGRLKNDGELRRWGVFVG